MASSALSRIDNLQRHLNPSNPKGMLYPQNGGTAKEVEAIVRKNGAVLATIAILDGVPCIGLSMEELEKLAKMGKKFQKTARRDIAHVVGIPIFGTGDIGGVHRYGESDYYSTILLATMDRSSDLTELRKTSIAVISADSNMNLGINSGILVAVPIPKEYSASENLIETAIQKALTEAWEQNITGSAETPFLLARVNENYTGGASLASNIALVKNNAPVGAQIAVSLARLQENS